MSMKGDSYLESQYDLRARHPDHRLVKAETKARSDWVREHLEVREDISCQNDSTGLFDLIPGHGRLDGQPAVIFIHGGFWRSGDKRDCAFLARPFHDQGVATILLNYPLAPSVRLDQIIKEVRASVAHIVRRAPGLGLDSDHIILGGHSAGGHLAAMVEATHWSTFGWTTSPIKASFGISGLYDPRPLSRTSFQQVLELPEKNDHLVATPSNTPKQGLALVACGTEETMELQYQSQKYSDQVKACLGYNPLRWVDGKDHYSVMLDLSDADSPLFQRVLGLLR